MSTENWYSIKNKLYMHVATMNNWMAVYQEMMEDIRISGLLGNCDITVVSVGGKIEPISNCRVVHTGKPLSSYELPTLQLLYDELEDNTAVCYCHSKGVANPMSLHHRAWRREMCEFNLIDWQARIAHLQQRYTSGAKITDGGAGCGWEHVPAHKHYSGNFWWARSSYLKELGSPSELANKYPGNRMVAESWIGQSELINSLIR